MTVPPPTPVVRKVGPEPAPPAEPTPVVVPPTHLWTTKGAAKRLTVSVTTVKRLRARGDLAYVKVGWSTRYTEREISRYLRSRERRTGRAA